MLRQRPALTRAAFPMLVAAWLITAGLFASGLLRSLALAAEMHEQFTKSRGPPAQKNEQRWTVIKITVSELDPFDDPTGHLDVKNIAWVKSSLVVSQVPS